MQVIGLKRKQYMKRIQKNNNLLGLVILFLFSCNPESKKTSISNADILTKELKTTISYLNRANNEEVEMLFEDISKVANNYITSVNQHFIINQPFLFDEQMGNVCVFVTIRSTEEKKKFDRILLIKFKKVNEVWILTSPNIETHEVQYTGSNRKFNSGIRNLLFTYPNEYKKMIGLDDTSKYFE